MVHPSGIYPARIHLSEMYPSGNLARYFLAVLKSGLVDYSNYDHSQKTFGKGIHPPGIQPSVIYSLGINPSELYSSGIHLHE